MKNTHSLQRMASVLLFSGGALVCGCSGSYLSTGEADATEADAATFEQLSASVTSTASGYQAAMMAPGMSATSCADAHAQYDASVRPMIAHMRELSAAMDDYLSHHGGAMSADYNCMSATMMDELDYHRSRACLSTELSADQAEVTRHVVAMRGYGNHLQDRCQEVMATFRGTSAGFSAMAGMCQTWDGQCTGMMHSHSCASNSYTDPDEHVGNGAAIMGGTSMMSSHVDR